MAGARGCAIIVLSYLRVVSLVLAPVRDGLLAVSIHVRLVHIRVLVKKLVLVSIQRINILIVLASVLVLVAVLALVRKRVTSAAKTLTSPPRGAGRLGTLCFRFGFFLFVFHTRYFQKIGQMLHALGVEINGAMVLRSTFNKTPKFKVAVVKNRYLIVEPQVRQIREIKIHTLPPPDHFGAICDGGSKKKFMK